MSRDRHRRWTVPAVFLAGVVAFLPALRNGFISDDHVLVESRFAGSEWDDPGGILTSPLFGRDAEGRQISYFYRPWISATHVLDAALFGDHPALHHLHNLLVHAAVSVLLLLVLEACGAGPGVAAAVALLFALHPLHAENVVIVTGRPDLWAAACLLGGLLLVRRGHDMLALGALALALLSKELALVFPVVLAAAAWGRDRVARRRAGLLLAWGFALVAALVVWRFEVVGVKPHPLAYFGDGNLGQRALTFLAGIGAYARFLVLPLERGYLFHFPLVTSAGDPRLLAGLAVLALLVGSAVWGWRRGRPLLALGAGWTLFFLLPTANLVPLQYGPVDQPWPFFERFAYLASMGFLLWAVELARLLVRAPATRGILTGLAAAALVFLAWRRTPDFRDDVTLLEVCARHYAHPATPLAYAANYRWLTGDTAGAEETVGRALAAEPDSPEANLAAAMIAAGRAQELAPDDPTRRDLLRAAQDRLETLAARPRPSARVWDTLGTVRALQGFDRAAMDAWRTAWAAADMPANVPGNMEFLASRILASPPPEEPAAAVSHWAGVLDTLTGGPGQAVPAVLEPYVEHARRELAAAVAADQH